MGEIVIVRHGQANSEAKTEEDYDRLSDLGWQQSRWLGEWMRDHEEGFDHVISGTLRRHRETASGMGVTGDEDARLNEIDYYTLSHELHETKGVPLPDGESFIDHFPQVINAWEAGEIAGQESFENFRLRISEMLEEARRPGRRILWVTSGGVIGMAVSQLLRLDNLAMSRVLTPIRNTSIHRLHVRPSEAMLAGFNATPHLDAGERAFARTFY